MPKLRLTHTLRVALKEHVAKLVGCPDEKETLDAAYKLASAAVRPAGNPSLPVILLDDAIARIKADVAARAA